MKTPEMYDDHKYRWVSEHDLRENTYLFRFIAKIMGIIFLAVIAMNFLFAFMTGNFDPESLWWGMRIVLLCILVVALITGIVMYIYYRSLEGKYCSINEMDENGILIRQMDKQFDKIRILGMLGMVTGMYTKSPAAFGAGMAVAANQEIYCSFYKTKKIKVLAKEHTLEFHQFMQVMQVFVEPEIFDFVLAYVKEHCPNAKIINA